MTANGPSAPRSLSGLPAERIAVGWATVELDRAALELAPLLAPGATFEAAADSRSLGARCRIGRAGPGAAAPLMVLLEPITEGRLAATLARFGEGWCATWERVEAAAGTAAQPEQPGPLGPERLVRGGPRSGPHRLLLSAATIGP